MEPEWSIIIGVGVVSLLREIYLLFKFANGDSNKSEKKIAPIISIILGLLVFFPFIGVTGIAVGIFAYRKTVYAGLSITGIVLSSVSVILWLLVALNGA